MVELLSVGGGGVDLDGCIIEPLDLWGLELFDLDVGSIDKALDVGLELGDLLQWIMPLPYY